jgi:hypothetical protein
MSYAFPADLMTQVLDRWHQFVTRHDHPAPPLPAPEDLRHILETAFFASLEREEGRPLQFMLCCAPDLVVRRDGPGDPLAVLPIRPPRPMSVDTLRALAPAVSPNSAAILVHCPVEADPAGRCTVAGIVNVGSDLARARSGRSFYHRPAPYALLIDVRNAGELHVYRGGIRLASLQAGHLMDQLPVSGLEFLPISGILAGGERALRPRLRPPRHEPERETSDFQWIALLNTILSIVNGVRERGHGGTILLVAPEARATLPIRIKYDVDDPGSLSERFVDFLNLRHELIDARVAISELAPARSLDSALSHLQNATFVAEEDLADAADLVARLAGVDGAVVLQSDLRVLGFGAEIVLDAAQGVMASEVTGHRRRSDHWPSVDSERFGMRHRSALRCVARADDTAAFVISQDGTVTFLWKQDDRVLLRRNVNTSNPNMIGA